MTRPRTEISDDSELLTTLRSVGPSIARDLRSLGIQGISDLKGRSGSDLYQALCTKTGKRQDPCVLDVFRCAVAQAEDPALPTEQQDWWYWSRLRKGEWEGIDLTRIWAQAEAFVRAHARPVDRARLEVAFHGADCSAVLQALEPFQNADGGFGNALEPDFRLAASSVMATLTAFQFLMEAAAPADSPMVQRGVGFLLANLDRDSLSWQAVPPEIDQAPRAPWWTYEGWHNRTGQDWLNPNAEVLGVLCHYSSLVDAGLLKLLKRKTLEVLHGAPQHLDMHNFLATNRLAERASGEFQSEIRTELCERFLASVSQKEDEWSGYGLNPDKLATSESSPLVGRHRQLMMRSLRHELTRQEDDGSWRPAWSWGADSEDWQKATREWAGFLTVEMLWKVRVLTGYGVE